MNCFDIFPTGTVVDSFVSLAYIVVVLSSIQQEYTQRIAARQRTAGTIVSRSMIVAFILLDYS
jgi:hypothetical protein